MPEVLCEGDGQQRRVTADVQGTAASFADLLLPVRCAVLAPCAPLTPSPARARAQPAQSWLYAAVAGAAKRCAAGPLRRRPHSAGVCAACATSRSCLSSRSCAGQVWHGQDCHVRHHHHRRVERRACRPPGARGRAHARGCATGSADDCLALHGAAASGTSSAREPPRRALTRALSQCAAFVGGLPVHADTARLRGGSCHVVVGTPGRLRALIQDGSLRTDHVRLLVRCTLRAARRHWRDTPRRFSTRQTRCLLAASSTTLPLCMAPCQPESRRAYACLLGARGLCAELTTLRWAFTGPCVFRHVHGSTARAAQAADDIPARGDAVPGNRDAARCVPSCLPSAPPSEAPRSQV